jgi:peptide/nickel transport system permease protein
MGSVRHVHEPHLRGDFGRSFDSTKPVRTRYSPPAEHVDARRHLHVLTIGIGCGSESAPDGRGSSFDKITTPVTMALYGTPEFFLGMLFLAFLGARLGWFPTGGVSDPAASTPASRRSSTAPTSRASRCHPDARYLGRTRW